MSGLEWFLYVLVLASGAVGVVWAVRARASILAMPAGNERMQEIAAAIQEGATAYLRRQYTPSPWSAWSSSCSSPSSSGFEVGIGYAIGACLSAAAGFIGMNVSVRANARTRPPRPGPRRRTRRRLQVGCRHRHVRRGPGPLGRRRLLRHPARLGAAARDPGALVGLSFAADLDLRRVSAAASSPRGRLARHLVGKVEAGIPGRSPQPGRDRGQCRRQCRRLRRHGGRPVRNLRRHLRRHHAARGDRRHRRGTADARW